MKDKRLFVNPIRMLSPKLDSEVLKIEELHQKPVSESYTLEEGLLIMLSKLIKVTGLLKDSFRTDSPAGFSECQSLLLEVHQHEKLLTANLACAVSVPQEVCKKLVLFPTHLERVGDFLESILNCCRIKIRDAVPFTERTIYEITSILEGLADVMVAFRSTLMDPDVLGLDKVINVAERLDQTCQNLQLDLVNSLLDGTTAPRVTSLYLDLTESTQSAVRHVREMGARLRELFAEQHS